MKLSLVRAELLQDATLAGLEAAMNAFFESGGERQYVDIQWMAREYDAAPYTVMILYTE